MRKVVYAVLILLVIIAVCTISQPKMFIPDEMVFAKLQEDTGYGVAMKLKDGQRIKVKLYRALCPLSQNENGEIFVLSESGRRLKKTCFMKPKTLVLAVLNRVSKDQNEDEFFEYLEHRW